MRTHRYNYTCLWLKWFASSKTREGSTGVQKFEWLCWLAAMTSENVRSGKAAKNSHFCCLLVFSKQLKESTCWALLLSKLPDRRLITPILVVLMYKKKIYPPTSLNWNYCYLCYPRWQVSCAEGFYRSILGWIPSEATCFTVCVRKVFHVLITFHRKVLEYNLGVFYGVPVMTLVTWRGLWVRWPRPPSFGPGGNMYVDRRRMINVELWINF